MALCDASSIVFDGHVLGWFGPEEAQWSVPAGRLRAIRELVANAGDVRWFVVFDIDGQEVGLQSPANANGIGQVLAALGKRLNATLDLELELAAPGSSRIVWARS